MTYKRRKYHRGDTHLKKGWRTKRRTKDLDEINEDLKEKNVKTLLNQSVDLDKPGAAQFYCVHCARYFINDTALQDHFTTKVHKRRLKALESEPYSIEESERAAGHGNYIAPQKRKIETITRDSFNMDTESELASSPKVAKVNVYSKHTVLNHKNIVLNSARQYCSALFVTNVKGKEYFSFLSPYLDFDERFKNINEFQRDLTARGLNLDATEIKNMWEFYKSVNADKSRLQSKSDDLTKKLHPYFQKTDLTKEESTEFTKLKVQIKAIKKDLKMVKDALQDLNRSILVKMLHLPNKVDKRTPVQVPIVLKSVNSLKKLPDSAIKSHVEIGRSLGLLEYKNPMQYYLCNDAALLELGVLNLAGKIFNSANTIRVAGADFSRSLVVEGSGLNHEDPAEVFILENHSDVDENSPNRMHLVGGASLVSFLAMHAKQQINSNHFPVAYFSTGRQYTPFRQGSMPIGLFTVCQASAVVAFTLVKDSESTEYQEQFEKLVDIVSKLYNAVCDHYQIVMRPAAELKPWETMRISFELWSAFSKQYIEVGHISLCGDYFSKRLMIVHQEGTKRAFPSAISGTVLSVPRLLGCLLEQNPEKFIIPQKILEHLPIDYTSS